MRKTPVEDYLEEISITLPEETYGRLSDAIYETNVKFDQEIKSRVAENVKLRELMYERAHAYAIQNMTEDELRITATNALEDNAKLRELVKEMRVCLEDECKRCHKWGDTCDLEHEMRELGIEIERINRSYTVKSEY